MNAAKRRHDIMVEAGLLDADQPTEWAHQQYVEQMTSEFTPEERRLIRHQLFASIEEVSHDN